MSLYRFLLTFETQNDVQSVAKHSENIKQLAKALIRLRVCAGRSEALLVAHTTLLEISCRSSNIDNIMIQFTSNRKIIYSKSFKNTVTANLSNTLIILLNGMFLFAIKVKESQGKS